MRVHQQPAYVLLNRPYSETSWIVELFSRDFGRLALMAKGARRLKSRLKGVLLPFQPLLVSWTGKGEVPTLTAAEIDLSEHTLAANELLGEALVCGFYCNELVVNLLHRHDPHQQLYQHYHTCIMRLNRPQSAALRATELRRFERDLMRETGYEVSFAYEADGKTAIDANAYYQFHSGQGFLPVTSQHAHAISGKVLQSMLDEPEGMITAAHAAQSKYLMREILNQTLAHKKIVSRELFFPRSRT